MTTPSPWDDPRITAYVMGELSGDERIAFENEIATNTDLSHAVDEARSVTDKLTGLFAAESTPPLSDERRQDIASGANTSAPTISDSTSWKVPMLLLATAAVVALMIGIAPMIQDQATTVSQSERDSSGQVAGTEAVEFEKIVADAPVSAVTASSMTSEPASVGKSISGKQLDELIVERRSISAQEAERQLSAPDSAVAGRGMKLEHAEIAGDFSVADEALPAARKRRSRRGDADMGMGMDSMGMEDMGMEMDMETMGMMGMDGVALETEGMEAKMDMGGMDMGSMGMGMMGTGMPAPAPNAIGNQSAPFFAGNNHTGSSRPNLEQYRSRLKKSQLLETKPGMAAPPDIRVVPREEPLFGRTSGDKFDAIIENEFKRSDEETLSTFSIDVDTASYSKTRDILMRANQWPRPNAVRIEEMVNYFDYDYTPPANDAEHPFTAEVEITSCPWNDQHRLARIGIQGKTMEPDERPRCNLVFLIDTSGSMNSANKLPLVLEGLKMLTKQLDSDDRVAIVVYAGSAGLVLDSTSAKRGKKIAKALTQLSAGGSTNGGAGIQLAYQTARENFVEDGVNRVILCSDGDFNVGTTGTDALVRLVEDEAKSNIFLTVLGFGMGNHNDAMMEQISGRGNGNYAFIDNSQEAHKVLVNQISGTLVTIAKDVKLQVDFNPAKVNAYRLIGYENRIMAKEDFNDDTKDAGEIGAGHSVTALYEIVPAGIDSESVRPKVEQSKYIAKPEPVAKPTIDSDETLTVRIRYKQPDGDTSTRVDFPIVDQLGSFEEADEATRFAAAVAGFGMQLRNSNHAGDWEMPDVLKTAKAAKGADEDGLRAEFIKLVKKASSLK
ncbi:MAG: von Willebrand factor type A domain-containing protein [Rubripirellula sp.]